MTLSHELRTVLAQLPSGVTIVSTRGADGSPLGATVSAVSAVSEAPPQLLVCLDRDGDTAAGIEASEGFTVNIPSEHQRAISSRFAGAWSASKVTGLELIGEEGEPPRLAGAIAHLRCRVVRSFEVGDRLAVVGEVTEVSTAASGARPLVYFRGRFSSLHVDGDAVPGEEAGATPRLEVRPRPPENAPTVAIAGGGFCGTMTAVQLLRRHHPGGLRVVLIERRPQAGRGLAYSTPWLAHRLNVPAGQMSALPDEPDHFLRWVRRRDPSVGTDSFVPRFLYGDYLEETLAEAERAACAGVFLERIRDEAAAVTLEEVPRRGVKVDLNSGAEVRADWLVLAIGNAAPAPPSAADQDLLDSDRYWGDPWNLEPLLTDDRDPESVILLGTGLTMVDVALTLGASSGRPTLHAVSRHGLLPRPHRQPGATPLRAETQRPAFALQELLPELLVESASAADRGDGWRSVVDSVRPVTNQLWDKLDDDERTWFIDHLSRLWEIHRHRMAPEVAMALAKMRKQGDLKVLAAEIEHLRLAEDGVELEVKVRDTRARQVLRAARVVNCTGPAADVTKRREPLMASLLGQGLARPDRLALGLDIDRHGSLIDGGGRPSRQLFTIGSLRKGRLWETTAVPELRVQAYELADHLHERMGAALPRSSAAPAPSAGA